MSKTENSCAEQAIPSREPLPDNLITLIGGRVGVASDESRNVQILIGLTNKAGEEVIYTMSVDVAGELLGGLSEFIHFEAVPVEQIN